jgi:hypothetical protein
MLSACGRDRKTVSDEELARIPIVYVDGRNDSQDPPELFAHL